MTGVIYCDWQYRLAHETVFQITYIVNLNSPQWRVTNSKQAFTWTVYGLDSVYNPSQHFINVKKFIAL